MIKKPYFFIFAILNLAGISYADTMTLDSAAIKRLGLRSHAVLVQDHETGQQLYGKNAGAVLPVASITKLMTAIVILDSGQSMSEVLTISSNDIDLIKHSRSKLKIGSKFKRGELLLLSLMASENRAASALANNYPGGVSSFVKAMNCKAKKLGMTHTNFEDATGLSSSNVSTAQDLTKLVIASYNYPLIRKYSTTPNYSVPVGKRTVKFRNSNSLVRNGAWHIGLSKTGYISEAGRCLVMQAYFAKKPVIIVLLDSAGKYSRIADAKRIRQWIESKLHSKKMAS